MKSNFNGLDKFDRENNFGNRNKFDLQKKPNRIFIVIIIIIIIIITAVLTYAFKTFTYNKENNSIEKKEDIKKMGKELDSYNNVEVYDNGIIYTKTYGENYGEDGYYYGYKWQCVEYVKRFYHQAKNHKMPDVYGDAKDFFDETVPQGELNESRDLVQYRNGENVKPMVDDLVVFTEGEYGHVAIITKVGENYIEVIQQNVYGKPREKFKLTMEDGKCYVGEEDGLAGWLRKE